MSTTLIVIGTAIVTATVILGVVGCICYHIMITFWNRF